MDGSVDISVLRRLIPHQSIDHLLRHLTRSRIVKIGERVAIYFEL